VLLRISHERGAKAWSRVARALLRAHDGAGGWRRINGTQGNLMSQREADESRRNILAALLATPAAAALSGCIVESGDTGESVQAETSALTVAQLQALCNAFYAMTNAVEIRITMPATEWDLLRLEEPQGGRCNYRLDPGIERYTRREATVTISGSVTPVASTFSRVSIKKKSHCGSFHTVRPSFKLDFGEFISTNKDAVEALIGTSHLTLNNSLEDASFVRQPLSYHLFRMAGLPSSRCNFCRVFVNGNLIGVYVNVEPIKQRFIENNFGGNVNGNLYEFEFSDDFKPPTPSDPTAISRIDVEKPSRFTDRKDLLVAATELQKGVSGLSNVIDVDHYIRFAAMEFLLKHNDSYTANLGNNTYVYNDVQAVADPTATPSQVRFKLIPSGTDRILKELYFGIEHPSDAGLIGKIVRGDSALFARLRAQIGTYGNTIVSRQTLTATLQFIDQMRSTLVNLGAVPIAGGTVTAMHAEIDVVKKQLGLVRSAAWIMGGGGDAAYMFKNPETGTCLRASPSRRVGGATTGNDWEVVHRLASGDQNDWWGFSDMRLVNQGNGGWLHASASFRTPSGRLMVYTTRNNDNLGAKDFFFIPHMFAGYCTRGTFVMRSRRTGLYLKFGTDDAVPGSQDQRVYQTTEDQATPLIIF
jgi:hypothetical protein